MEGINRVISDNTFQGLFQTFFSTISNPSLSVFLPTMLFAHPPFEGPRFHSNDVLSVLIVLSLESRPRWLYENCISSRTLCGFLRNRSSEGYSRHRKTCKVISIFDRNLISRVCGKLSCWIVFRIPPQREKLPWRAGACANIACNDNF